MTETMTELETEKVFEIKERDKLILDVLILIIGRLSYVARDIYSDKIPEFDRSTPVQLGFMYADGFILESIGILVQSILPELNLRVFSKAISRKFFSSFENYVEANREKDTTKRYQISKAINNYMLNDTSLGNIDPRLPTIWIDSAQRYSFVQELDKFPDILLGSNPIFFSILFNNPYQSNHSEFLLIMSSKDLYSPTKLLNLIEIEDSFRLPIKPAEVTVNGGEMNLEFSAKRAQKETLYYPALRYVLSKYLRQQHQKLLSNITDKDRYSSKLEEILAKIEKLEF